LPKAYYWYRKHLKNFYGSFHEGAELKAITSPEILLQYPYGEQLRRYFSYPFSPHGLSMLYERKWPCKENSWNTNYQEPITELFFELVRQRLFPKALSRLSCIFASETLEDAERWMNIFLECSKDGKNPPPESLWEIEFESSSKPKPYDAKWLDVPPDDSFLFGAYLENARKYWNHVQTASPLPELLIPYPVVVSHLVRKL